MAGDYIMLDHDLPDKQEVMAIFEATGVEIATICGRLFMLWKLADRLTEDGVIDGMGMNALCAKCGGDRAFWEAVQSAGWVRISSNSTAVPRFKERFGDSARKRMLGARRKQVQRLHEPASGQQRDMNGTEAGQAAPPEPVPVPEPVPEPEPKKTGTGGAGVFANVEEATLRDTGRLLAWNKHAASRRRPIVTNSEADILRTVAAAERALECGDSPVGLFAAIFRDKLWTHITADQEDRAVARLKAHRANKATGPPREPSLGENLAAALSTAPTE